MVETSRSRDLLRRVAREIAAERERRGLSQEKVAERLETATRNYQRIEAGKQNLTLDTIQRVADAIGTTSAALLAAAATSREASSRDVLRRLEAADFKVTPASRSSRKPPHAIEVTTLRAAAGRVEEPGRATEILGWVDLGRDTPPPRGQFVAAVVGQSMAPRIPSGSLCLFGPAGPPPYGKRVFLVSLRADIDDDASASFLLKRITSIRRLGGGRRRITLGSINPTVKPISIETYADDDLRIVAELIDVMVRAGG